MFKVILLIAVVIFFALNMGASGIAPSFAALYGGKLIKKRRAVILFGIFVVLGALCLGKNVSLTLGKSLLPQRLLSFDVTLIILVSAAVSLFLANFLKIPQSTSQVTVMAIVGVGLYFRQFYVKVLLFKILPMWVVLPMLSYLLTFFLYRIVYPPRHHNLHFYQKIFTHAGKIRLSALIVSSYVAFAIGTNNVANAVGPLFGAGIISISSGLFLIAPLFSIGGWLMGKGNLETAGNEIVPLGLVSSTIVSFVTATLLISASLLGVPQSLVQLNLASIFAISCVKNGHKYTLDRHIARKTFVVWSVTPLLSLLLSYILAATFLRIR